MDYSALIAKYGGQPEEDPQYSGIPDFDVLARKHGGVQVAGPEPIGQAANERFLREEVRSADPVTRNLAGAGTALRAWFERGKQLTGQGDEEAIRLNEVIAEEAPGGAVVGQGALAALPFGLAGNTISGATKAGAFLGFMRPVEGEQTAANIAQGTAKNVLVDAALAGAGQKVANVAGKMFASKADDLARAKVLNAERDATLKAGQAEGLVVPPSSVNPSWWNQLREGVGGKIATAQQASNKNDEIFNALSRRTLGLADDAPLTSEAMQEVRNAAFAKGYAPVRQFGAMPTDKTYLQALDDLVAQHSGAAKSFPKMQAGMHGGPATPIQPEVVKALEPLRVGRFDSGDAIDQIAVLREDASKAYRAGDTGLGKALKGAAKALEDQIERNLKLVGKDGAAMLDEFRNARKLMAKAHTVEDAIVQGGGAVNPKKYAARYQAKKPMSDELEVMGAFANNFPRASQPAAQVAGPAVSKLNSFASMIAGGGGFGVGGPVGAAVGAALPFVVPGVARSQMLSRASQNALLDMYRLGLPTRTANRLLPYAPGALTVAGSNAFLE